MKSGSKCKTTVINRRLLIKILFQQNYSTSYLVQRNGEWTQTYFRQFTAKNYEHRWSLPKYYGNILSYIAVIKYQVDGKIYRPAILKNISPHFSWLQLTNLFSSFLIQIFQKGAQSLWKFYIRILIPLQEKYQVLCNVILQAYLVHNYTPHTCEYCTTHCPHFMF